MPLSAFSNMGYRRWSVETALDEWHANICQSLYSGSSSSGSSNSSSSGSRSINCRVL